MLTTKLEVLVDFGPKVDENIVNKTLNELKSHDGIKEAIFKDGAIVVETSLPSSNILEMVTKSSGKRAVLQGFGESQSAVAMISSQSCCKGQVLGVIRFQQSSEGSLVADGSIDGLPSGLHGLHVHDAGDLSQHTHSNILEMVTKSSGKRAVLQGFGESQSAVAMISSQSCCKGQVLGVIRFQQSSEGSLVADGSIDGLPSGLHGLHVHDAGDLSQGCSSIGEHYNPLGSPHGGPTDPREFRHAGDLGNIVADETGRATFRIVDEVLKVWDIVGRSVAVSERRDDLGKGTSLTSKVDGDSGQPLACGIIARSAGVFQNPKRICACDGVVVWDEKERPLAGKGRRQEKKSCCQRQQDTEGVKPCCKV